MELSTLLQTHCNKSTIQKLLENGFKTVNDLDSMSFVELSKECSLSKEEAKKIVDLIQEQNSKKIIKEQNSALDILLKQNSNKDSPNHIVTFCRELDQLFVSTEENTSQEGGIPLGTVIEFCGAPGIGKTQLAMQLAANVQIPLQSGGVQGKAIIIDTEGSFDLLRFEQICQGVTERLQEVDTNWKQNMYNIDWKQNVYFYRVQNRFEQIALLNLLPSFLQEHSDIKLIIVDSITSHFRYGFENMHLRSRVLHGMAQTLTKLANDFHIAIVLMNQITTKFSSSQDAQLAPALGESWHHAIATRIWLSMKQNNYRVASVLKSPFMMTREAKYMVHKQGIRDVVAT